MNVAMNATASGSAASPSLSVVITNWNYGRFVAQAIDSALAVDWPAVQVIVVDDGSTDDSRAVIRRYGDRIAAIFQENAGQTVASNVGFARVTGEAVIFLDADDLLDPSIGKEVAAVWQPGVSKVQFQMKIIDADGQPTGAKFPQYSTVPSPQQIRRWASRAAAYPTPPGSGNVYARWFLQRLLPLQHPAIAPDSCCLAAAPHLGDVVTVAKPLVAYRVHGQNDGAMLAWNGDRLARELRRARWRFAYGQRIARTVGVDIPDSAFRRSLATLPYRLASLRLAPRQHPVENDSLGAILLDTIKAAFVPQGRSVSGVVALVAWTILVAILPDGPSKQLALWRFASPSRPKALQRALALLRVVSR
jgi:glycosyltransferase involved in cell wall biosynthesis